MSRQIIDITGQRFGRLEVIKRVENNKFNNTQYLCRCDCGNEIIIPGSHLRNGNTSSCGCYKREYVTKKNTKHNLSKTRLYGVWGALVQRCENPKNADYDLYGGRGVKLIESWRDYQGFHKWATQNGYDETRPYGEQTLERINVDGDYSPDNCKFASLSEQANNKRNTRKIVVDGRTYTIKELANICNIDYHHLYNKLKSNNFEISDDLRKEMMNL